MKVAIIHYWLVSQRGGEKVLDALCAIWPEADIFTHVYDPAKVSETLRRRRVQTTFIQKLPFARKLYKKYLPLMPHALEVLDLTGYDLVISSESGPAKGVLVDPTAIHICYCHSPMRYIWDQYHIYRSHSGMITRAAMALLLPALRAWDFLSAARVDHFVANSRFVASRIDKYYRRQATVIHPPVDVDQFAISDEIGDYYLAFGQLVRYKRFDIAVDAFTRMGKRLIVAGTGEEEAKLKAGAGASVEFVGWQSDAQIRTLMSRCKALIFPGEEDFGIVPVEAMASGRPVIAYGRGGALETVVPGKTGVLFEEQSVDAVCNAVEAYERDAAGFDPHAIRAHAELFRPEIFAEKCSPSAPLRQFRASA
jgi:glycosyltransferase involved in cell wall biosynthesis